jgi:hypothetical protein
VAERRVILYRADGRPRSALFFALALLSGAAGWGLSDGRFFVGLGCALLPLVLMLFALGEGALAALDGRTLILAAGTYGWRDRARIAVDEIREMRCIATGFLEIWDDTRCLAAVEADEHAPAMALCIGEALRVPVRYIAIVNGERQEAPL